MSRRILPVAAGMTVLAAALAGCSAAAPASLLGVYETRAEDIHTDLVAHLPAGAALSVQTSSRAWIDETEWLVPRARQVAHWTTESTIDLADPTAHPAAAEAVGALLVAEGWTAESIVESGGARSDIYRLGVADSTAGGTADSTAEWIVEVQWTAGRHLVLVVQSPVTVRGDAD
jgi:hypothetical protein